MRECQAMSNGLRTIVPRERSYALAPNGVGKGRRYRGGVRTMLIPLFEHERAQTLAGHCLHATRGIVKCHADFANDLLRKKFDNDGAINRRAEIDAGFGRRAIGVGDGERFTVGQRRPITDACASTVAQNETAARLLARQRHAVGVGEGHQCAGHFNIIGVVILSKFAILAILAIAHAELPLQATRLLANLEHPTTIGARIVGAVPGTHNFDARPQVRIVYRCLAPQDIALGEQCRELHRKQTVPHFGTTQHHVR